MKKILVFIYVFIVLILLKLVVTYTINEIVIYKYGKEDYDRNLAKSLFVLNYNESYIAHYNYGNVLYNIGYYEDAIKEYNLALENKPRKDRVCSIRVNLSLSIINTINEEMECEEKYEIYEKALGVLLEDDCAREMNESGTSEVADKLEEEIRTLYETEKATCEQPPSSGGDGEEDDDSGDEGEEEKSEEEKKSDELDERNKDAQKNRQDELDMMEDYDDYGYSYYNGKKW